MIRLLLACTLLVSAVSQIAPSHAADTASPEQPAKEEQAKDVQDAAPADASKAGDAKAPAIQMTEAEKKAAAEARAAAKKTYNLVNDVIVKLKPAEQKHLFMTYTSYNLLQTVKTVQGDVGKAIQECGKNNPDMKGELDGRFKKWNDAVSPMLKEADGNINNMVLAQDYAPKEKIQEIFDPIDRTREKSTGQIEKIPVTSKEACGYLIGKMDETQETMLSLLRSTLVTLPQAFQGEDEVPVAAPVKAGEAPVETKTDAKEAPKPADKPAE